MSSKRPAEDELMSELHTRMRLNATDGAASIKPEPVPNASPAELPVIVIFKRIEIQFKAYQSDRYIASRLTFGQPTIRGPNISWDHERNDLNKHIGNFQWIDSVVFDEQFNVSNKHMDELMALRWKTWHVCDDVILDFHCGGYGSSPMTDLTDHGVKVLVDQCPNLQQVSFIGAKLTELACQKILFKCSEVKYINVSSTHNLRGQNPPSYSTTLGLIRDHDNIGIELECLVIMGNPNVKESVVQSTSAKRKGLEIHITRMDGYGARWWVTYHGGKKVRCVPESEQQLHGW